MKKAIRQFSSLIRLSFLELWRRNDIVGLVILAIAVMVPLTMAKPFGAVGATRFLDEFALLLVWAFSLFIALGTGSRLMPPEFETRTIHPLVAKPISRGRLLVGKYAGAVTATWSAVLFFYVLYAVSVFARGGSPFACEFFQGVALHLAFAALAVALSLLGSLVVTRSANLSLVAAALLAMFFFGRKLPVYAETAGTPLAYLVKAFYVIGPHAEFFDMRQRLIHGWGAVDAQVFMAVIAYAIVYIALLLGLSALIFRRRRI